MNKWINYLAGCLISLMLLSSGCATNHGTRIDNIPMYGQPKVERPEFLKKLMRGGTYRGTYRVMFDI